MFNSVTELMICIASSPLATVGQRLRAFRLAKELGGRPAADKCWRLRYLDLPQDLIA